MSGNPRRTHGDPTSIGSIGTRILRAWSILDPDRRLAGAAAGLLLVSMFMPWYQQNAILASSRAGGGAGLVTRNLSAFAVFSFIEAFVLVSALGVLTLLFVRAERRGVRLPAGDGTVILIAGGWTGLLLIYRLFDKPDVSTGDLAANMGIQWGIFFALLAAGLLVYAGSRIRSRSGAADPSWAARETRFDGFQPGPSYADVDPEIPSAPQAHPAEHEPTVLLARDTRRGILPPREVDATVRFTRGDPPEGPGGGSEEPTAAIGSEEETTAIGSEEETAAIGSEEETVNRQLSFEDPREGPAGPRTAAGRRPRP